ncbi:MAG TPA: SCO family protein [Cupriavidus sp.]|nr:SCO family protein [Cupriavidus sp.]
MSAWTLDERRDLRIASLDLRMPATAVRNQQGHGAELFSGNAPSTVYIVDFIYTRCNTVCSALGGEFAQLSRQVKADGLSGRLGLVSISLDARDTAGDLKAYATTYRASLPEWEVVTANDLRELKALLRQTDVIAIPDGMGGITHNGALDVVSANGVVLATYPMEQFQQAYLFARSLVRQAAR